jgi:hypothetical protein
VERLVRECDEKRIFFKECLQTSDGPYVHVGSMGSKIQEATHI